LFDAKNLPEECHIVGEVKTFEPRDWMPGATYRMAGRFSQFAIAAAKMARTDSGFDFANASADDVKVVVGTSMNGLADVHQPNFKGFLQGQEITPWASIEYAAHAATNHVATASSVSGQTMTIATACAAGLDAVAWAADEVRRGTAKAAIAVGTETPLSECTITACQAAGVLAKWNGPPDQASRPFDRLRSGLVLAEGSAAIVIEEESFAERRGARIYARVLGSAGTSDGGNLRKIDPQGEAGATAMRLAIKRSRIDPDAIDYICAHGNSMVDYDAAETSAIKSAFGRGAWNIPVSSLKSMCGQALGASGAMQVVATCLALQDGLIPPTINFTEPDPKCDLDYVPNKARSSRLRSALIHAQSIGGTHVALVLSR
jgi:3-oxoacyl-(acyl-carrier-protein) synthase